MRAKGTSRLQVGSGNETKSGSGMKATGGVHSDKANGSTPGRAFEHLPPERPLAMPAQDFAATPRDLPHRPFNLDLWARRTLVVLLALLPASLAAHELRRPTGLARRSGERR